MKTLIGMVTTVTAVLAALGISYSQTIERGRALFEDVAKKYPDVQPTVLGLTTANPTIAIFIPEVEWNTLSRDDQMSLTLYVKSLVPLVRANPDKYIEDSYRTGRSEPFYGAFPAKVRKLCEACWVLGIGRLTLSKTGVLFDKVVAWGDPTHEQEGPRDRVVTAAQPRQPPYSVAVAGKQTDLPERKRNETLIIAVDVANIRGGPGTRYDVIGWGKRGDSFPIRGRAGDWYKVGYQEREAWIHKDAGGKTTGQSIPAKRFAQPSKDRSLQRANDAEAYARDPLRQRKDSYRQGW